MSQVCRLKLVLIFKVSLNFAIRTLFNLFCSNFLGFLAPHQKVQQFCGFSSQSCYRSSMCTNSLLKFHVWVNIFRKNINKEWFYVYEEVKLNLVLTNFDVLSHVIKVVMKCYSIHQTCQLSRFSRESPSFSSNLPVSQELPTMALFNFFFL